MTSFSSELGVKFPIQLEAAHVIPESQVCIILFLSAVFKGCDYCRYKGFETVGGFTILMQGLDQVALYQDNETVVFSVKSFFCDQTHEYNAINRIRVYSSVPVHCDK